MQQNSAPFDWARLGKGEAGPRHEWDKWGAACSVSAALLYLSGMVVWEAAGEIPAQARWILAVVGILLGLIAITAVAVTWSTRCVDRRTGRRAAQLHLEMAATEKRVMQAIAKAGNQTATAEVRVMDSIAELRAEVADLRSEIKHMETRLRAELASILERAVRVGVEYERRNGTNGTVRPLGRQTRD